MPQLLPILSTNCCISINDFLVFENCGFSEKNIKKFIKARSKSYSKNILSTIRSQPLLFHMSHVPLLLTLITSLLLNPQGQQISLKYLSSVTVIYESIILRLFNRPAYKEIPKSNNKIKEITTLDEIRNLSVPQISFLCMFIRFFFITLLHCTFVVSIVLIFDRQVSLENFKEKENCILLFRLQS
jgi:hypothetical protein